jgi:DNA-binding HxlR family transcriptional regulator
MRSEMHGRYDLYCPVAHALKLVGEKWALFIVLELMRGPKRYTDLAESLPGIGTNILASRLRDLESAGIVTKRRLPPPAASRVYELTDYGRELKPAIRELALWGARSLGPPGVSEELFPGWLANAIDTALGPIAPAGRFEFRIGDEVASLVDGDAVDGPIEDPDVIIEGDPAGVYHMFVDRSLDCVQVKGDRRLLKQLIEAAPQPVELPVSA